MSQFCDQKYLASYLSRINYDEFIENSKGKQNYKDFIEAAYGPLSLKKVKNYNVINYRPYYTNYLWSLYFTYKSICCIVHTNYFSLKDGCDLKKMINYEGILKYLKIVMPEDKFSDKIDDILLSMLLEKLEEKILLEIKEIYNGEIETKEKMEKGQKMWEDLKELKN